MSKEAMRLALEALEWCHGGEPCGTAEAITALREALAEQKSGIKQVIELYDSPDQPSHEQEPVAIADVEFMRKVLSVAIVGLYEHYKDDVLRVFTLDDLQTVVDLSESLRAQLIEDIYRRAWDMLKPAPQPSQQKLVAFEEWLAKQHGDPEEIGFLQALRISYIAGQDSITSTTAQRTWVGLTKSEITTSLPYSVTRDKGCFHAGALWAEAKLKEKNNA